MIEHSDIHILAIDDSSDDIDRLRTTLESENIHFHLHAINTRAGFEASLSAFRPDIVFSECAVGDLDIRTALNILAGTHPDVPFVPLVSALHETVAINLMRDGASDYVLKESPGRLPFVLYNAIEKTRLIMEVHSGSLRDTALFQNNHTVMLIIDPDDGRLSNVNQAACDYYGYSRDTLLTMNIGDINILPADKLKDEIARAVAEKRE